MPIQLIFSVLRIGAMVVFLGIRFLVLLDNALKMLRRRGRYQHQPA